MGSANSCAFVVVVKNFVVKSKIAFKVIINVLKVYDGKKFK